MKTKTLLTIPVLLSLMALGCAKAGTVSQAQSQANLIQSMGNVIALPVQDNSYSAQTTSGIKTSGQNFQTMVTNIINPVCAVLEESNIHFAQLLAQGAYTNNNLTLTDTAISGTLTGSAVQGNTQVNWTYNVGNYSPYFTGNAAMSGASGTLTFPSSSLTAGTTMSWSLATGPSGATNTITVNTTGVGNLQFVESVSGSIVSSVTFSGNITTGAVSGTWDISSGGGSYTMGGTKYCYDSNLNNQTVCQ